VGCALVLVNATLRDISWIGFSPGKVDMRFRSLIYIPTWPIRRRLVAAALFAAAVSVILVAIGTESKAEQNLRPPMFVLQVGIGKYLNAPKWTDLRGPVTDVVEMRKVLESDRFQVPAGNIVTLKDEQATKQQIFTAFRDHLIANARNYFEKTKKRDAVVLFQFSGHGSQVPDVDGDEADKLDETLVTYDSQDVQGKNFDITDDEIFALTSQLKKYTDNIVYIFDSCHSGSGTRNAEDARRLPARTTVPEPVSLPGLMTRSSNERSADNSDGGVLPPGDDYIVISAAGSEQLATQKYCFEECGATKEPVVYGLLSYYLIDELKNSRNDTSYRELMDNVSRKVSAERPSQTPVIEGDERRAVFGSLGKAEDNFVPIIDADAKTIRIRAGAIQGLTVGTVISVYDKAVARFDQAEKIATGRVSSVGAAESTVQLVEPKRAITTADKALAASSDLGSMRLKVSLDNVEPRETGNTRSIAAKLRDSFAPKNGATDPRGVDVVPSTSAGRQTGRWNVALLKDKYSKVFPASVRGDEAPKCSGTPPSSELSTERDVYYIAGPDYIPLFGFCVEMPANETVADEAADKIEKALTHISRYRSIQSVKDRRSRLAGKVIVKPIRLTTSSGTFTGRDNCKDGKFVADNYQAVIPDNSGKYPFRTREVFWFEVTNNSAFDLYLAMLNLKADGSIALFFPRNIDGEKAGVMVPKNGGKRVVISDKCRVSDTGQFIEAGALRTPRTRGLDAFKFIATMSPMGYNDLSYLEMDAIERNGNASLATSNEWLTVDLVFQISD